MSSSSGERIESVASVWSSSAALQFKNNYFTKMCSGSEAGSYSRLIDFVYHSTLGLRVIKRREERNAKGFGFIEPADGGEVILFD